MSDLKNLCLRLRWWIYIENMIKHTRENKCAHGCAHVSDNTWEAAKHGVSVVSSVKNLQRVPILLRDKADYLDLRQWRERSLKKKKRKWELGSRAVTVGSRVCMCREIKSEVEGLKINEWEKATWNGVCEKGTQWRPKKHGHLAGNYSHLKTSSCLDPETGQSYFYVQNNPRQTV